MARVSPLARKVNDVSRHVAEPVTIITPDANHASVTRFCGFSIRESAAIAGSANVNLRRGSASGQILAVVQLAADSSSTHTFPFEFETPDGVYVEEVSGTVSGVLMHRGS